MRATKKKRPILLSCERCGVGRNHAVLKEHVETDEDQSPNYYSQTRYQICKCQGCNTIRFRTEFTDNEACSPFGGKPEVAVYPKGRSLRHKGHPDIAKLPVVGKIYFETVVAYNSDCLILAGGGLRAIVEAICKRSGVKGRNLQQKIDALVERQVLATPQAELLHQQRYIGNSALHETHRPDASHVRVGIEIVEGLLNTIYLLPAKAAALHTTGREALVSQVHGEVHES